MVDPEKIKVFLKSLMQHSIMWEVLPLVSLLAPETTSSAILSISKPHWTVFGSKRQVLPWFALSRRAGACAQQLIILFIIVAPRFPVPFKNIVGVTEGELCLGWKRGKC